jgi:hypothetical protein
MSYPTYSREHLVTLPIQMRKAHIKNAANQYVDQILGAARMGQTSHLIVYPVAMHTKNMIGGYSHIHQQPWTAPATTEELQEALLEQFPGCKVTYEEKWVSTAPDKQELKKGILIDWS